MKLIVVSNSDVIANEDDIINSLFDEGLELFHLRKPTYDKKNLITLLNKINSKYHSKIVLHQHHTLTEQFEINRIHISTAVILPQKIIIINIPVSINDKFVPVFTGIEFYFRNHAGVHPRRRCYRP